MFGDLLLRRPWVAYVFSATVFCVILGVEML